MALRPFSRISRATASRSDELCRPASLISIGRFTPVITSTRLVSRNVSPTFDYKRLSYRAGLSYNAANIFSYAFQDGTPKLDGTPSDVTPGGVKGPLSDTYFYPHLQIDMQGSVGMGHGLSFIGYILNVNNEVFGFYNGSSKYVLQREYYKPTYAMGLRWNPTFEKR